MKKRTPSQRLAGIREALERAGESRLTEIAKGTDRNAAACAAWNELVGALAWLEPDIAEKLSPGVIARIAMVQKKYLDQIEAERASEYAINNGAAEMWGDE
jgi:hypothetical protein